MSHSRWVWNSSHYSHVKGHRLPIKGSGVEDVYDLHSFPESPYETSKGAFLES